jgi:hypothetical protein
MTFSGMRVALCPIICWRDHYMISSCVRAAICQSYAAKIITWSLLCTCPHCLTHALISPYPRLLDRSLHALFGMRVALCPIRSLHEGGNRPNWENIAILPVKETESRFSSLKRPRSGENVLRYHVTQHGGGLLLADADLRTTARDIQPSPLPAVAPWRWWWGYYS